MITAGNYNFSDDDFLIAISHIDTCMEKLIDIYAKNSVSKDIFDITIKPFAIERLKENITNRDINNITLNDVNIYLNSVDILIDLCSKMNLEKGLLNLCNMAHIAFFNKIIKYKVEDLQRVSDLSSKSEDKASAHIILEELACKEIREKYYSENYYISYYKRKSNISTDSPSENNKHLDSPGTNLPSTSESSGCYIATAVYGSYDAPEVLILRAFRDDYLLNKKWGRKFVKTYYKHSPSLAENLKNRNIINKVTKVFLDKFVCLLSIRFK